MAKNKPTLRQMSEKEKKLHGLFSEDIKRFVEQVKPRERYTPEQIQRLENYKNYIIGMIESGYLASESYDLLNQASPENIAQYVLYSGELEKIIARSKRFNKVVTEGTLGKEQVDRVLNVLPIEFYIVNENVPLAEYLSQEKPGIMDVYHRARVISLYPQSGNRLSKAVVRDMDFPLRSDCIMDDNIGLRCCYHPKLTTFGINPIDDWDEIEIDIHKYSKDNVDGGKK